MGLDGEKLASHLSNEPREHEGTNGTDSNQVLPRTSGALSEKSPLIPSYRSDSPVSKYYQQLAEFQRATSEDIGESIES